MNVHVKRVNVPAMSTIGYGWGVDYETGDLVKWVGDHRPMRHLGEAIAAGEDVEIDLDDLIVMSRTPASVWNPPPTIESGGPIRDGVATVVDLNTAKTGTPARMKKGDAR